jgi:hypothetical protein
MYYQVVLQSAAAIRFPIGAQYQIAADESSSTPQVTFTTRYGDFGLQQPIATGLIVVVGGDAEGLNEAASQSLRLVNRLSSVLSLVGNGAIQDAEPLLVLGEPTPHQEFAQFIGPELPIAEATNILNVAALKEVIELLSAHPKIDRLLTAIRHYALAMRNWRPGYEMSALSSLFAGMEALKSLAVAGELATNEISRADLAKKWNVELKDVDSEARKRILFQDDEQTHGDAAKARHGYVHGFLTFETVDALAVQARGKTASYLRSAILKFLGVSSQTLNDLLKCSTPPTPGTFNGVTGTKNIPISIEDAAALGFRLLVEVDRRPKDVRIDPTTGFYSIDMSSNMVLRGGDMAISGSLYTTGTSMSKAPTVTAVKRGGDSGGWVPVS